MTSKRWRVTIKTPAGVRVFYVYADTKKKAADAFISGWGVTPQSVWAIELDTDEWKTVLFEGGRGIPGA